MGYAQALTIAGSDSGGGAGVQADLKTFQMRKVFGTSVLTAITAQNTQGVYATHLLPTDIISKQIQVIKQDFQINAVKIGMLGSADIIKCVAESLSSCHFGQLVLDPVMIAKGGAPLLAHSAISAMKTYLLPKTDILTPNLPEAEALTGVKITNAKHVEYAARLLQDLGVNTVIIKGGHLENSQSLECIDWVFLPNDKFELNRPRFSTVHTHGTGCTFSACLTAELAKGKSLESAVKIAKDFITIAISNPLNIGHGHGPVNHWAYKD